jgi:DNA-binding transcriptional regulator GbsR (MarR family)
MPGNRLTNEERATIAAGLNQGLGYAEIARALSRPTSTISREVNRNGGHNHYHASLAGKAARRRSRRGGGKPPTLPASDAYGRDSEAVRGFVEQFALLMAQTGLSRMASRVLVCLFVSDDGALTAAELVQYLGVSPASVSKAVRYLEELELVRRERDAGARRERYVVDDDVWMRAWAASTRKNATWADAALEGAEILGKGTPAGKRLEGMSRFFAQLVDSMAGHPSGERTEDALTVLAALLLSRAPLTPHEIAHSLDWPLERVAKAMQAAPSKRLTPEQQKALADWAI